MIAHKMKDSAIPWIGEIPEEWEIVRLKNLYSERTELSIDGSEMLLSISEYYGVAPTSEKTDNDFITRAETLVGYKKCFKNDFVSNIMLAWKGSFGTTDYDGIISPAYCVYKPIKDICPHYYHYLLRTDLFKCVFKQYSKGVIDSRLRLYTPYFLAIHTVYPPFSEQEKIASWLDEKCSEIDELIEVEQKMIEELEAYRKAVITETVTKGLNPEVPLKHTSIPWLPEIPLTWHMKKLKFSCNIKGRIGFRGYTNDDIVQEGEGAITLSPSNMKNLKMDFHKLTYLSWNKYFESPEIMIKEGDVLMVKTGSTYGKVSFVENLPLEATINPQIIVLKDFVDLNKFILYVLASDIGKYNVETSVVGGTIPTIAQEKILNYLFPIPPMEEQGEIVSYLDTKCKEIDDLISVKREKIDTLKQYRQSIIFEAVTGKIQLN